MDDKDFRKLVRRGRYQVFLLKSRVPIPGSFAVHTWFVLNKKGKVIRWDFGKFRPKAEKTWGFLHRNVFASPTRGIRKGLPFARNPFRSFLVDSIEGKKGSVAEKMIGFIEKSPETYPFKDIYKAYPGPNSNTYMQWVLSHFPGCGLNLSWNAVGKNWRGLKDITEQ